MIGLQAACNGSALGDVPLWVAMGGSTHNTASTNGNLDGTGEDKDRKESVFAEQQTEQGKPDYLRVPPFSVAGWRIYAP